jgi:aldehyde:ferredoxin oxidoreductase
MKQHYYEAIGWDEQGIPTTKTLTQLGLEDVDKALQKLRT